jgi:hypothetical protein
MARPHLRRATGGTVPTRRTPTSRVRIQLARLAKLYQFWMPSRLTSLLPPLQVGLAMQALQSRQTPGRQLLVGCDGRTRLRRYGAGQQTPPGNQREIKLSRKLLNCRPRACLPLAPTRSPRGKSVRPHQSEGPQGSRARRRSPRLPNCFRGLGRPRFLAPARRRQEPRSPQASPRPARSLIRQHWHPSSDAARDG